MTLRIQVLVNFGGVETNGLRILPGEYAIDDDRLLGCGQLLVDRGQARVIGDDVSPSAFVDVTKQLDEAFTASEEAEAVDEAVNEEAEAEAEDDHNDDTPQAGRKRRAR